MEAAVAEARCCEAEDDRHHPRVGAVLTDAAGAILLRSHRGADRAGGHAEFLLLEEARRAGLELKDTVLFVTLEPCSRRSIDKVPCAVRVAESGIRTVFVGTLDPNPQIIGRGLNHLVTSEVTIEHFPADLRRELADMNATFEGTHGYLVDPVVPAPNGMTPRQAAGILATTLDLIANAKGDVRIFAGDTSWLPTLFVGLLEAGLHERPVRLLAQKTLDEETKRLAQAVGVTVCHSAIDTGIRGTLTSKDGQPKDLLLIEKSPARHALTFSAPHEAALLRTYAEQFEAVWDQRRAVSGEKPQVIPIPFEQVEATLRLNVPPYSEAKIAIHDVPLPGLLRLTDEVEIFKLRRVAATRRLMTAFDIAEPSSIVGTPWGFFPPIVEKGLDGSLTLIDGIHRVYHSEQNGDSIMRAILVEGVSTPLPCQPLQDPKPRIVRHKSRRDARYLDYEATRFRPIRAAIEAGEWIRGAPTRPVGP